ncbi:hypothetical protein [Treponema pedis]|uniref:hypothetical protein n=1 Tax=Treponema pedis TaxID=409322 RepID=UPI000413F1B9|nr:hypothetical protein [Treponema pedis]
MKLTVVCFLSCVLLFTSAGFAQETPMLSADNPDSIYPAAKLGEMFIHMSKITSPFKGNAPAIEILFQSDKFYWEPCTPPDDWGQKDKTFKYFEEFIPGTTIIFNITNRIDDVTYYKTDSVHPYNLPIYNDPAEAEFLKRFVFFKFTATAAKSMSLFRRALNNDLGAIDTHTKLIYAYSMPTDYEKMIGNNYIPQKWMPYELAPNTKDSGLKFYEYDPIGFVSEEADFEFFKVKTNMHFYDWWYDAITVGRTMKTVKAKRFMPVINPKAEEDWSIRDAKRPVRSPYRKQ